MVTDWLSCPLIPSPSKLHPFMSRIHLVGLFCVEPPLYCVHFIVAEPVHKMCVVYAFSGVSNSLLHERERMFMQRAVSLYVLTKATLYYYKYTVRTTTITTKHVLSTVWIITSQTLLGDHHTSIVLYGLVLLKPFTIVDKPNSFGTQRMLADSRCSGNTTYCFPNTCNGKLLRQPAPFQGDNSVGTYSARSSPAQQSVSNANTYHHLTLHYYQVRIFMPPPPFEGGGTINTLV